MSYTKSHLRQRSQASYPQAFADPFADPFAPTHHPRGGADFYAVDLQNEKELIQLPALPDEAKTRSRRRWTWITIGIILGILAIILSAVLGTLYVKAKHAAAQTQLDASSTVATSSADILPPSSTISSSPTALAIVLPAALTAAGSSNHAGVVSSTASLPSTTFVRATKNLRLSTTTTSASSSSASARTAPLLTSTVSDLSPSPSSSPDPSSSADSSSSSDSTSSSSWTPPPSDSPSPTPSPSPSPSASPSASPSSSSSSSSSPSSSSSSFTPTDLSQTYSGLATHFPGSQLTTSALACGDAYTSPSTTLFLALCHSTFDSFPGTTSASLANENRSPACGDFVQGRKDLSGNWLVQGNGADWVVVGGDGALNCVGTEGVRCHVPRRVSVSYAGRTVQHVMVVDRNQGINPSPCAEGDVDVSDLVYRTLAGTTTDGPNGGLGSELQGVTWVWE